MRNNKPKPINLLPMKKLILILSFFLSIFLNGCINSTTPSDKIIAVGDSTAKVIAVGDSTNSKPISTPILSKSGGSGADASWMNKLVIIKGTSSLAWMIPLMTASTFTVTAERDDNTVQVNKITSTWIPKDNLELKN